MKKKYKNKNSIEETNYVIISTVEEAKQFQSDYYGIYCDKYHIKSSGKITNYLIEEAKCIDRYLGNEAITINKYLRGNLPSHFKNIQKQYDVLISEIKNIIYNAPKIPFDMVVYRGVDSIGFNAIDNDIKKKSFYVERGFLSTSLLKRFSENNNYEFTLKIYVPKNSVALGVTFIRNRGDEQEILFPPGCCLIPIGIEKEKTASNGRVYVFLLDQTNICN